ncbi:MAG TPA: 30S ribosomal protein S1 [Desulfobulbaceae bacterium]|nr:30S ribosomal protein S1 [Desulfobulbaceae bacterium]
MTAESFEDLFQKKSVSRQRLQPGDRIEAVVAGLSGENIFLDIGGKSEGIVRASEFQDDEGNCTVQPGDRIKAFFVARRGGEMIFTTRLGSGQASLQELEDAFHAGIPVEGKVAGEIKGGFEIQVAGVRAFCPYSQMDIRRIEDPDEYIERTMSFKVTEFSSNGRNIILSSRAVLEEQREEQRQELQQTLEEGMRVTGTVTSIREFGAFVDLGGIDGLIPISELAWGQTDKVEDILSRGQQVEVTIKKLDWDNERISLSLRETTENPWTGALEKYPPGSVHQATVSRLAAFGAFITLEPGVDGLLHISKLGSGRRINHPREVLEVGQPITVKIDSVDLDKRRIALLPEDYTEEGGKDENNYTPPPANQATKSMGTLGDLLQAQMKGKK